MDKEVSIQLKRAFKKGFAIGYKKGYCHRSDKEYKEAMFNMWKKYVAAAVFKKAKWGHFEPKIEGELEIVEPKKIIL